MAKKVHWANLEITAITRKDLSVYRSDLEIYKALTMNLEEIAVSAMMRGLQLIENIDMSKHPYPKGLPLKKVIYRLSENQSVMIANTKLQYTDKSPVPTMDKYRIMLEFGLLVLRRDLDKEIKKAQSGKKEK